MGINLGMAKSIAKSTSITYGSIGVVNVVFAEPNIFRFTLADSSTKDAIISDMDYFTAEEKAKLSSLNETILTKFTLDGDGNLLYNGKTIGSGSVTDSTTNGNILIDNVETNVYTHPTTHSPSIIAQDSSNRFVTDTDKTNWNNASTNSHTHSNKTTLDNTTASYTTEEKTKLSGISENANNYILPVASSNIGGVKSGTDITIDVNGNVSVNDNSHNHTIDNVDGLQTALDDRYTKLETLSKDEINTLVNSIANGMNWKEKVTEVADLPLTGNTDGDTRVVTSTSTIYIWNNTSWVNVGSSTSMPMASATNSGQMSSTQYSKLESIVIENLATVTEVNTLLADYVLKDGTKVLSDENYTTTEKTKLSTLSNYDDTTVKADITDLKTNKVDKVTGKSLVLDTEITKIHSHSNLTNLDKIGENGEGHLTYNGVEIVGESGATINDIIPSKTTTYSSDKIDILTQNKVEISNLIGGENIEITSENGNVTFSSPSQIDDSTSVLDKTYSSNKIDAQLNEIEEAVQSKINDTIAPLQTGYKIPILTANPASPVSGEMWILKSSSALTPSNVVDNYSQASPVNLGGISNVGRKAGVGFILSESITLYDIKLKVTTRDSSSHTVNNPITVQLCEVSNNVPSTVLSTKVFTVASTIGNNNIFDLILDYQNDNITLLGAKEYCFILSLVSPLGTSYYSILGTTNNDNENLFAINYYSDGAEMTWHRDNPHEPSILIRKGV